MQNPYKFPPKIENKIHMPRLLLTYKRQLDSVKTDRLWYMHRRNTFQTNPGFLWNLHRTAESFLVVKDEVGIICMPIFEGSILQVTLVPRIKPVGFPPDTHTKMFLHAPFHPCGEKIKKSREEPLRRHCSQEKSSYPSRIHNSTWDAENHHLESLNRWTLRRSRTPGIVLFPTIASLKGQSGRCQWFRLNDSNLLHFELSKELSTKRSSRSKSQIKVNSHSVT